MQDDDTQDLSVPGSSQTPTSRNNNTNDFNVDQNVDQVGADQDKVLYNISTQALSLLILLGIISGLIVDLYFV